jgi:ABC-type transporter Mla subunit MlaD
MNLERQELRTGLLVFISLAVFVAVLVYLGAPGVFVRQKRFRIYVDDAGGLKPGAQVMLAGRKIGQVHQLFSPVPEKDRPTPKTEALIEVRVDAAAPIYQKVKVSMTQPKLLGEMVIDFTNGEESSGLAPDGHHFLGTRAGGLADAVPAVLEKLDPVLKKATDTLDALQKTADNLTKLTSEGADLTSAFTEFRQFGRNLNEITGPEGSLRKTVANVETLTGPEGKLEQALDNLNSLTGPSSSLAKTLGNAERFTASLVNNRDLEVTLRNFRRASEKIDGTLDDLSRQFRTVGSNLEQASDTVKRQPWRLIWPSTKSYEGGRATPVERPREKAAREVPSRPEKVERSRGGSVTRTRAR